MKKNISLIMYHYVRNLEKSRYPKIKGLTDREFVTQIDYLQKTGDIICPEVFFNAIESGDYSKLGDQSYLLTFDDGYIDHYTTVLPILAERNLSAFFSMPGKIIAEQKLLDVNKIHFILAEGKIEEIKSEIFELLNYFRGTEYKIPSNQELYEKIAIASRLDNADTIFIKRLLQVELEERLRTEITDRLFTKIVGIPEESFCHELYLTLDQIKMMRKLGMMFGIHGYDHTWMNRMEPDQLAVDIEKSLDVFSGIIDNSHWVCCYPYGSVSDTVIDIIREKNAFAGMTSVVGHVDTNELNIFRIPRMDTNDYPPKTIS